MTETNTNPAGDHVVDAGNETVAPEEAMTEAVETPAEENDDAGEDQTESSEGADEGDVAADYLEELLDIIDLDGDLEIEIRGERTFISIQAEEGSDDLDDLVGPTGEVLDALQELTRLAVLTVTGQRTRLVLDVNGHRVHRNDQLKSLAADAVSTAQDTGESVHLDPMSSFERKIVHDYVADAGLSSESEGEGKRRHVVVTGS